MIVSIHQPQYMPYIGFFHKLMLSDIHVFLDDAQYNKNAFINRNRIKTANGNLWLTVPVHASIKNTIKEVVIDNKSNWKNNHLKSIINNYSKTSFFQEYRDFFEKVYSKEWNNLSELNIYLIQEIAKKLNLNTKFVRVSDMGISSDSTQRLIDICKKLNADTYISGPGGNKYMDVNLFKENSIKLVYQEFNHPVYNQRFGKFTELMSIIDLLFNHGSDSTDIIKNSGGIKET